MTKETELEQLAHIVQVRKEHKTWDAGDEQARRVGKFEEREQILELLTEMRDTALETKTAEGTKTAWVLQNAISLISKRR